MNSLTKRTWWVAGLFLALMLYSGTAAALDLKCGPKVDNFILFPDQSGSMYMTHKGMGEIKEILVKRLLLEMNEIIPEAGYKGALYMFAPFQPVVPPEVYERGKMSSAIQTIPDDQPIFGRLTPMGPGIDQLGGVLGAMGGSTAIIMLSDGRHNLGADPVAMARAVHNQYPNICFHVISFAEDEYGKSINQQISQVGANCLLVDGPTLLQDKAALEQFVRDVFCAEVIEETRDQVMILRGIHFDFDKYNIKPEWVPVLNEAVQFLRDNPNVRVVVEGHTDSRGTVEYNQKLSERRAQAVYKYMLENGISADRMSTEGFSELRPKATNDTDEGRAINRRVEFQVQQ